MEPSAALIQWVIRTGLTVPLLLYVVYHIKWGKIQEIEEKSQSVSSEVETVKDVQIEMAYAQRGVDYEAVYEQHRPDDGEFGQYLQGEEDGTGPARAARAGQRYDDGHPSDPPADGDD